MAAKKLFILLSIFSLICFIWSSAFAQKEAQEIAEAQTQNQEVITQTQGESPAQPEAQTSAQTENATVSQPEQETNSEPEIQWIWGDVVSINPVTKTILVRYIDYDTDSEKEISIDVDEKTTYDNAKSLDEIKVGDSVSIDYISSGAKNLAKNVSLEKPDITEEGNLPEVTPEEAPIQENTQTAPKATE